MSGWQVGDLVVCVDDSPPRFGGTEFRLSVGRKYRISALWHYPRQRGLHVLVAGEPPHKVLGYSDPAGWNETRFRKVAPDKHEACEDEFVTLLSRSRVSA